MMQMPVHQMIFILLLSICCASTAAPQMAKPGCPEKRGNVIIPYPFGIGPDDRCYYDEWFQIDCNESTEGKPFLRRTKLEVLNISTDGRLQVYSPVTFFCEGNNRSQLVDLRDSPFFYYRLYNTFTAVSCDSFAQLNSTDFVVGGCESVCDHSGYLSYDIGINCCQISIPPYLSLIKITLLDESHETTTTDCTKLAFLIDKDWVNRTISSSSTISGLAALLKRMGKVPISLRWRILNDTRSFELFNPSKFSTLPVDPSCHINTSPPVKKSEIDCSCREGFEGNPYLGEKSCDDINECQDAHRRCSGNSKCVNEYGSYRCEDDGRKAKLILATGGEYNS